MFFNLASWGHMLTNPHFTFVYLILVLKDALFNKASFHYPCVCRIFILYDYSNILYIRITYNII